MKAHLSPFTLTSQCDQRFHFVRRHVVNGRILPLHSKPAPTSRASCQQKPGKQRHCRAVSAVAQQQALDMHSVSGTMTRLREANK